jgi:hypothetical protein
LEGEFAYDFEQVFTETFEGEQPGGVILFERAPVRMLHLFFGPKFHTPSGPFIGFFTIKGGLVHFRFDDPAVTAGNFFGTFTDLRADNTRGVLYPAAGLELYGGVFGLRFEIGDEIYFFDGANHNLRMTFGPSFRF